LKDAVAFLFMAAGAYKHLYNTKRWYRLRWHQLQEYPLCAYCAKLDRVCAATVADHIKPHRGDEDLFFDERNLQSLCKPCHDGAKQQLEKSGTLRGCDESGLPLDSNHHWNKR
jgi:5-methylcytosine-specific restriction endonuclease McrA